MPSNVQLDSAYPLSHGLSGDQLDLIYGGLRDIEQKFWAFDRKHPAVYRMIVHLARGLKKQGFKSYSMDALFHRIRWHHYVRHNRKEEAFKLDNNFTSHYARLVMQREPDLADFFPIRKQRSKERKCSDV